MTYTTCKQYETLEKQILAFDGCVDRWNREIGVIALLTRQEFVEIEDTWGYTVEPGIWFQVYVQQIRNGKTYGASFFEKKFRSIDDAMACLKVTVEKRRKEYTKKYAPALVGA